MRKVLAFLMVLACVCARGSDFITATIQLTNVPVALNALTNNSAVRTWSNVNSATLILTNSVGIKESTTNLYNHISRAPFGGTPGVPLQSLSWSNATSIVLRADAPLLLGIKGGWATVSYFTNQISTNVDYWSGPVDRLNPNQRTNNMSQIAYGLGIYPSNQIPPTAKALTNFLNKSSASQTVTGIVTFPNGIAVTSGTNDGTRATNIVGLHGTNYSLYGGLYNVPRLLSPNTTNLVNAGNAISSVGSGSSSEQFGSGATASGTSSTAVGNAAIGSGNFSAALGWAAEADSVNDVAVGAAANANGGNSIAVGTTSTAVASNAIAIGTGAAANFNNSIALGNNAVATTSNQLVLGSSSHKVSVAGRLEGTTTNLTVTGTNNWTGDVAYPWFSLSTLAAGNNIAVPLGTNRQVMLSGNPAAATITGFAGGRDGRPVRLYNASSFSITLAQNTSDPTPANRLVANIAGDWAFQPGELFDVVWVPSDSRWHFEIATAAGTNSVPSSGASLTNLSVYPSSSNNVAATVYGLANQNVPVLSVVSNTTTNINLYASGAASVTSFTNAGTTTTAGLVNTGTGTNGGAFTLRNQTNYATAIDKAPITVLNSTNVINSPSNALSGNVLESDAVGNFRPVFKNYWSFGDGSDGAANFDGNVVPAGATLASAGVYRIDRDVFYSSCVVSNSITLKLGNESGRAGYRLFVSGTLTNWGTISSDGGAGGNATAPNTLGAAGVSCSTTGTVGGATAGGAGRAGGTGVGTGGGSASTAADPTAGGNTSTAGTGGNGVSAGGGGGSGATYFQRRHPYPTYDLYSVTSAGAFAVLRGGNGAGGGGAGGGNGTGNGGASGGGGAGGGILFIVASNIVNTNTISANGGAGGNGISPTAGGAGAQGGGAGGSGGGGGMALLIFNSLSNSGTITANGGALGTGAAGITGGTAGANGQAGGNGEVFKYNASLGVFQ